MCQSSRESGNLCVTTTWRLTSVEYGCCCCCLCRPTDGITNCAVIVVYCVSNGVGHLVRWLAAYGI